MWLILTTFYKSWIGSVGFWSLKTPWSTPRPLKRLATVSAKAATSQKRASCFSRYGSWRASSLWKNELQVLSHVTIWPQSHCSCYQSSLCLLPLQLGLRHYPGTHATASSLTLNGADGSSISLLRSLQKTFSKLVLISDQTRSLLIRSFRLSWTPTRDRSDLCSDIDHGTTQPRVPTRDRKDNIVNFRQAYRISCQNHYLRITQFAVYYFSEDSGNHWSSAFHDAAFRFYHRKLAPRHKRKLPLAYWLGL